MMKTDELPKENGACQNVSTLFLAENNIRAFGSKNYIDVIISRHLNNTWIPMTNNHQHLISMFYFILIRIFWEFPEQMNESNTRRASFTKFGNKTFTAEESNMCKENSIEKWYLFTSLKLLREDMSLGLRIHFPWRRRSLGSNSRIVTSVHSNLHSIRKFV